MGEERTIDLVVPMVFPQDAEWQRDYAYATGGSEAVAQRNVRFRSWGTEGLLVQCCRKHMPWLRRIYILLASESQAQPWMAEMKNEELRMKNGVAVANSAPLTLPPSLQIVYHREFMPENLLPCFNVNTIEMHLHRIPGLSEYFIYSNDDFFPLSPLEPSDFFRPIHNSQFTIHNSPARESVKDKPSDNMMLLPCQHFNEKPYPTCPNIFQRFVKNGLDMVAADFGVRFTRTWLRGAHTMQPMLLSTVREVCERHADRISDSFTIGRRPENFNQYIYPFWQHLSGQYVDYVPHNAYLGPRTSTEGVLRHLRSGDPGICCINDNEGIADWQQRAVAVKAAIEEILES